MALVPQVPTDPTIATAGTPIPGPCAPSAFRTSTNSYILDTQAKVQLVQAYLEQLLAALGGNGSLSGGAITAGSGLSVNVAILSAIVGSIVAFDASQVVGGLAAGASGGGVNRIWLRQDGTWTVTQTGTTPSGDGHGQALLWGTATTDGSGVTSVDNTRVAFAAAIHDGLGLGALALLDTVDSAQIADDAVTASKILDSSVSTAKLDFDVATQAELDDVSATVSIVADAALNQADIDVSAGGTITLDPVDISYRRIRLYGILPNATTFVVPDTSPDKIYINDTSGAYALTVKTAGGTGQEVPQGKTLGLYANGTNVVASVTDPTPLDLGTLALLDTVGIADTDGSVAAQSDLADLTLQAAGATTYDCSAGGTITPAPADIAYQFIELNGSPGAGFNFVVPDSWPVTWVYNNTGKTATIKTAAGTGVALLMTLTQPIRADGTNAKGVAAAAS